MRGQSGSNQQASTNRMSKDREWLTLILLGLVLSTLLMWLISPAKASADLAVTTHEWENGTATWDITDYPAIVLSNNSFRITLHDEEGMPLTQAELHITLDMIDMLCGDYSFDLTEASPGTYVGEGVPLMPGLWKASLTIVETTHKHGESYPEVILTRTLKATY